MREVDVDWNVAVVGVIIMVLLALLFSVPERIFEWLAHRAERRVEETDR